MNKYIKLIIITMVLIMVCGWTSHYSHNYDRDATVVDVNYIEITAKDNSGHYWKFIGQGFYIGQKVTLKMYDNHTDSIIKDDIIRNVKCGR